MKLWIVALAAFVLAATVGAADRNPVSEASVGPGVIPEMVETWGKACGAVSSFLMANVATHGGVRRWLRWKNHAVTIVAGIAYCLKVIIQLDAEERPPEIDEDTLKRLEEGLAEYCDLIRQMEDEFDDDQHLLHLATACAETVREVRGGDLVAVAAKLEELRAISEQSLGSPLDVREEATTAAGEGGRD